MKWIVTNSYTREIEVSTCDIAAYSLNCPIGLGACAIEPTIQISKNDQYYDAEFSRRINTISKRRNESARFERLNNTQSAKFNIKSDTDITSTDLKENMTALDCIYTQLSSDPHNINEKAIKTLVEFVKLDGFDTESMETDLKLNGNDGNIAGSTSPECVDSLIKIFQASQCMFLCINILHQ